MQLPLIYAPNPVFQAKAEAVHEINDDTRSIVEAMFETMYKEKGVGMGANMVGLLQRIIVVDLGDAPYGMINPVLEWCSKETQVFEEASLSFPGISAKITRPKAIKVTYSDIANKRCQLEADGFLATVIQHEMDYLDGRVYLDYLSPLKRKILLKKMKSLRARP